MQTFFHSWQILLAFSLTLSSFSIILQRSLMKNQHTDGVTFSIMYQLVVGCIIGVFALIHGFHFPNFLPYLPNLAILILFYGFGNVCMYKALRLIEASEFTILYTTKAIWTILSAVLFLHENFTIIQIVGTILILSSVAIIDFKKKTFLVNKGFLLALAASFLFGIAFTNDAFFLQRFDVLSYVSLAFILPGLGMLPFYPQTFKKMHELLRPGVSQKLFFLCILYSIASVAYFYAYTLGRNAAQITVIDQVGTILTVILAVIFLHESKDLLKKFLAAILGFMGILLVG